MIRFQRSAQLKRGKHGTKWAREITDHINTNFPEVQLQLYKSRFGDVDTVYWVADFEDIVHLDEWQAKVGADKAYRELRRQSLDIIVAGSVSDTLMVSA